MEREEMIKKLHTLSWQVLHDFAITKGFEKNQLHGRDKDSIINIILTKSLSDDEVEHLVNEYIYGDRVTFTLWTFDKPLDEEAFGNIKAVEGKQVHYFETSGFRNLSILSVNRLEDRIEVLYVYSKEYYYMDENGKNASVWEQHRGCVYTRRKIL